MFFFFNDTATTEIYTLSLHDALPICCPRLSAVAFGLAMRELSRVDSSFATFFGIHGGLVMATIAACGSEEQKTRWLPRDRKSTRLNSSHANISYAVFCLKKKKIYNRI